jgi:hypothetical protein
VGVDRSYRVGREEEAIPSLAGSLPWAPAAAVVSGQTEEITSYFGFLFFNYYVGFFNVLTIMAPVQ